ncbi:MAG: hypothetical protein AB1659_00180 [Thermodesulfobacteriota bacterium]
MKKGIFLAFYFIITLILINPGFGQESKNEEAIPESYSEFVENMDLLKHTDLHVKNYWQKMKGQEVTWSGDVVEAQTKRGHRAQVLIADKSKPRYKGYNIVLITPDVDAAAGFQKGESVKFKGVIHNYRGRRGNPLIVTLIDVYFIK